MEIFESLSGGSSQSYISALAVYMCHETVYGEMKSPDNMVMQSGTIHYDVADWALAEKASGNRMSLVLQSVQSQLQ